MTISKPKNAKQIKVSVQLQEIGNMSLHISNLLRGRVIVGKFFLLHTIDNINLKSLILLYILDCVYNFLYDYII